MADSDDDDSLDDDECRDIVEIERDSLPVLKDTGRFPKDRFFSEGDCRGESLDGTRRNEILVQTKETTKKTSNLDLNFVPMSWMSSPISLENDFVIV